MKKILHIWQAQYPWEVRVGKINRSLLRSGYEVAVAARGGPGEPVFEKIEGVSIYRLHSTLGRRATLPIPGNPLWYSFLKRIVKEVKPDALLVRDLPLTPHALKIGKAFSIPVVMDMAEHYPEAMRSWDKYKKNPVAYALVHHWKIPDQIEKFCIERLSGVVVVCDEQKQRLVDQYQFPENLIEVASNTPELSLLPKWNEPQNLDTEGDIIFGYHGILCEDRALEFVLDGFDKAAQINPRLKLMFFGGGESEEKLKKIAEHLRSKNRIEFTGKFNPSEVNALYKKTHFGIVSLRVNEFTQHTVANKFFDYPARGIPFIFTDVRPLVRIMRQMNCGISFKGENPESIRDAILAIVSSDRKALASSGRPAIESTLNWDEDMKNILRLLDKVTHVHS